MRATAQTPRWKARRLMADERPKVLYEYYVTGPGQFPVDMLRYDAAWPASGEDAIRMFAKPAFTNDPNDRSIKLHSYRQPTIGRWSSFLWSVGTEKLK